MSAPWWSGYVGIPFVAGGRDRGGCDCWGLLRLVLSERAGVDVPAYDGINPLHSARVAREVIVEVGKSWNLVTSPPQPLDGVLMRALHRDAAGGWVETAAHCGVMVEDNMLLHCEQGRDTVALPLDHKLIKTRIRGIYRHKALA